MTTQLLERGERGRHAERPVFVAALARIDFVLVATTLVLSAVGLVMVYSATRSDTQYSLEPTYFVKRQFLYVVLGGAAMLVCAFVDYRRLEEWGYLVYGATLLALLAVRAVGHSTLGASREITLGPLTVQPSEFAVLGLVIAVAVFVHQHEEAMGTRMFARLLVLAGVPMGLVYLQPDLGTTLIMGVTLFTLLVAGGIKMRYLLGLVAVVGLLFVVAKFGHLLHGYQLARLGSFLHQDDPAVCDCYQLAQSKTAIGAGGLHGTGLFNGAETANGFVPYAYADFIFSAIGEQLGFVGSVAVLGLFGLLFLRIFRAVLRARTTLGRLLCVGVLVFLAFSLFQNVGMSVGIMPITGIPLPFISYGGSALIASFAGVGLVVNVEAHGGGRR